MFCTLMEAKMTYCMYGLSRDAQLQAILSAQAAGIKLLYFT